MDGDLERKYWDLELSLADTAVQHGYQSREAMFDDRCGRLSIKDRQKIACTVLHQIKILKILHKKPGRSRTLRLVQA